jgi:hypothetical protein
MTIAVSSLSNRLKVRVKVVTFCTVPAEGGRPAFPRHPNSKINLKKLAYFSTVNLVVFPTTLSPQIHHDLPRTSPRFAHRKSQNSLQKLHFTMPEKITKYTAKDPDPSQ